MTKYLTTEYKETCIDIIYYFSEEAVFQHLEEFLRETDTVLQVQNKNHELELCLLLMQCFEVNAYTYRYVLI